MKIIKGISGFILFICLVAIASVAMMFDGKSINLLTACFVVVVAALIALVSFIVYIAAERIDKREINLRKFFEEELLTNQNARELQLKRR